MRNILKIKTLSFLFLIYSQIQAIYPQSALEYNYSGLAALPKWTETKFLGGTQAEVSIDKATQTPDGIGALKIKIIAASAEKKHSDIQIYPVKKGLGAGKYNITVLIKSSQIIKGALQLAFNEIGGPAYAGAKIIDFDGQWQKIPVSITVASGYEQKRLRLPGFFIGTLPEGAEILIASIKTDIKDSNTVNRISPAENKTAPAPVDRRFLIMPMPKSIKTENQFVDGLKWNTVSGDKNACTMFIDELDYIQKKKAGCSFKESSKIGQYSFVWHNNGNLELLAKIPPLPSEKGGYALKIESAGAGISA
ncbi:MAG TPA: hypothetical protein DC049_12645, partial [Spirochaetia bacterium]|nr:hypothetical protein [Spirochaetia bacterium]